MSLRLFYLSYKRLRHVLFPMILMLILVSSLTLPGIYNLIPTVHAASSATLPPETMYAGSDTGLRGDDRTSSVLEIGFSFTFYGNTYTQFTATTNGLIGFGGGATTAYSNTSIPNSSAPNNAIYGFWDDLMSHNDTQLVLYRTTGDVGSRKLIVQWTNYGYFSSDLPMGTFQIIIYEGTNNIRTQYRQLLTDPRSYGSSATIGLENSTGSTGVMYSYNTASLDPEQSILWTWNGSTYNYNDGSAYEGVYLYKDNPPPNVPELTAPANGSAGVSTSTTFSWNAALNADRYNLVVSTSANLSYPLINQTGLTSTSYSTSSLSDNRIYYWGVEAENDYGSSWSSIWSFSTAEGNSSPNDISLTNDTIADGLPINTEVGTFSTSDPDTEDTHTYSLVEGGGSSDNGSFNISGNALRTNASLAGGEYTIRVRTTDQGGLYVDESFIITVTSSLTNTAPTDIGLSSNSIAENQSANMTVGTLSTTDTDSGDTFTYTLVSGTGDTDNGSFNISTSYLRSNTGFDYEAKSSYSVRVRSTDSGGLFTEKQFTISITNLTEDTTTTIVSDNPDPSVYGQNYLVSVTVSPVAGAGTPTGTVNVSDGNNSCTITLSSGVGSCSLPSMEPDTFSLTAVYSGDTNWNNSIGTESHTIGKSSSVTTITSDSPDPTELGDDYSVTVTVAAGSSGSGTPTGTVAVSDGSDDCTIALSSGTGSCDLSTSTVGALTLTATYNGGSNFLTSSDTESHTVQDTTPPTVTINQASGQVDSTNISPIVFEVVFSEMVNGFEPSDISFSGSTTPGTLSASIGGTGSTYNVIVTGMTGSGDVVVSIPAGRVLDNSSNYNHASTSTDNRVTYDVTQPTVTIEQGTSQVDPTNSEPIVFDVEFSETVLGFSSNDVTITGMANTPVVDVSGSGSSYTVEISGAMDGETISAEVASNAALDLAGNPSLESTSSDNNVTYDISAIEVVMDAGVIGEPGNIIINQNGLYLTKFTHIDVKFDTDAYNPPGSTEEDDVTNPNNYYLLRPGENYVFNVSTCNQIALIGTNEVMDDVVVPVGPVSYDNNGGDGPFIARLMVNNGGRLPLDKYRLILCGSTTIVDLAGNPLNDGVDVLIDFAIQELPDELPNTGFPMGVTTNVPELDTESTNHNTGLFLTVPKLNISTQIIGVPLESDGWNTAWLSNYAGFLEGSAFPTWAGNTVITGHIWTASDQPGIFLNLDDLTYGDEIQIYAWGRIYTYEVRSNRVISDTNVASVMRSEVQDWVTLLTCDTYDPESGTFIYRRVVRAILVSVE